MEENTEKMEDDLLETKEQEAAVLDQMMEAEEDKDSFIPDGKDTPGAGDSFLLPSTKTRYYLDFASFTIFELVPVSAQSVLID